MSQTHAPPHLPTWYCWNVSTAQCSTAVQTILGRGKLVQILILIKISLSFSCFKPATPGLWMPFSFQQPLCTAWFCPEIHYKSCSHFCGIRASLSRPFGRCLQAKGGQKFCLSTCRHPSMSPSGKELIKISNPHSTLMLARFCTSKSSERSKSWQK